MESAAGTHSLSSTTPHVCAQVGSHLPTSAVHWFFSDTSVYPEFSKNTWHTVSVCFAHEKTLPKISHSSQDLKPRLWPAELMATKVTLVAVSTGQVLAYLSSTFSCLLHSGICAIPSFICLKILLNKSLTT